MANQIDFIAKRNRWFTVSAILILISIVFMAMPGKGLRMGIDFSGGLLLDLEFTKAVSTSEVRDALTTAGLRDAQIQKSGDGNQIIIRTKSLTAEQTKAMNAALEAKLGKFETLRVEDVKGVIGQELARKGVLALLLANVGMVLYVTLRFEYKFALTAIVALLHDVLIMLGFYAVTGLEANSPLIAAVLTVVGYSINDTIVVFDRIRENLKARNREPLRDLVNKSINQTMTRSLNTSLTTMLAILAVFIFGGRTIRDFSLALLVGVAAGTYSSIFVASPLWYMWKTKEEEALVAQKDEPREQAVRPALRVQPTTGTQAVAAGQVALGKSPSAKKPQRKR